MLKMFESDLKYCKNCIFIEILIEFEIIFCIIDTSAFCLLGCAAIVSKI